MSSWSIRDRLHSAVYWGGVAFAALCAAAGIVLADGSWRAAGLWALGAAIGVAVIAAVLPARPNPEVNQVSNGLVLVGIGVLAVVVSAIIRVIN